VHLCAPGEEQDLKDELARVFPASQHAEYSPGWLQSELTAEDSIREPVLGFARQVLPYARLIEAESISQWARQVVDFAIERGDVRPDASTDAGPWRLHVFGIPVPGGSAGPRRTALVAKRIDEELLERRRRLARRRTADTAAAWSVEESLLQVGLVSATQGYLSWASPALRGLVRHVLSRYPGGETPLPERNLEAPSRAFAKLVEAQAHFGRSIAPGEVCVDLGSSPGGWAYVALEQGARVIAVDRSPLAPAMMKHPKLEFHQGDAFRFTPASRVDWLLCDVAAFPQKTLAMLKEWLVARRCLRFVVTVKFRGREDYPIVGEFAALLAPHAGEYSIRRLASNKNEVTVMGELI